VDPDGILFRGERVRHSADFLLLDDHPSLVEDLFRSNHSAADNDCSILCLNYRAGEECDKADKYKSPFFDCHGCSPFRSMNGPGWTARGWIGECVAPHA